MERSQALDILQERYKISRVEAGEILPPEDESFDPLSDWWRWSPSRFIQELYELEEIGK